MTASIINIAVVCFLVIICVIIVIIVSFSSIRKSTVGFTRRLGNLVDAWYFGSLGSEERIEQFSGIRDSCDSSSFGAYLTLNPSLRFELSEDLRSELVRKADNFWASYEYDNIKKCINQYHKALRMQMIQYAQEKRPTLMSDKRVNTYDCVIHYRIGDFVPLGNLIHPRSVAIACASLFEKNVKSEGAASHESDLTSSAIANDSGFPTASAQKIRVGIMDGGMLHNTTRADRQKSKRIKSVLKSLLYENITRVVVDDCPSYDVDSDFYLCANAKKLVTAGGSFAICAAIANKNIVRTPACSNTNYCSDLKFGAILPDTIREGWDTYEYTPITVEETEKLYM